ncbi:hypothetical protein ACFQ6E_38760 [Streptomyces sp. NPDC056462]|uniref:hypothetical protein n=1 Tax=Streptomyces sp. NPDC056462 TaxID=3345826 RepID=UPI00367CC2EC
MTVSPGQLAGRRLLDKGAGRAQQVAGLYTGQQLVGDLGIATGAGDDRVGGALVDGVDVVGPDDQVEGGGAVRAGAGMASAHPSTAQCLMPLTASPS